jgi:tetratricopeptide (TPR) repeat protein
MSPMSRWTPVVLAVLLLSMCLHASADTSEANAVSWRTVKRTYPIRQTDGKSHTVTNVVLENRHIAIEVAPELAGRVMHVKYKQFPGGDGEPRPTDLFNVIDEIRPRIPWDCGGWRVSFPFYEHGMRSKGQPVGWRVVERADSIFLTMDQHFERFTSAAELNYQGRFSHLRLGRVVRLRPGDAHFTCEMIVDNPLPYRLGYRLWTTAQFPFDRSAEYIFPVTRMSDHRMERPRDWATGKGLALHRNWKERHYSFFSLNNVHPFVAVYYPDQDINRIRITDPNNMPGAKLFSWNRNGRFIEIWSGTTRVFEQEGHWLPAFQNRRLAEQVYMVRGIGRVKYANAFAAVGYEETDQGVTFKLSPSRKIEDCRIMVRKGKTTLVEWKGEMTPGQVVTLKAEGASLPLRLIVRDGALFTEPDMLDVSFPLKLAQPDPNAERRIRRSIYPPKDAPLKRIAEHWEKRGWINYVFNAPHTGTLSTAGLSAARTWVKQEPNSIDARVTLGRIAYRIGRLDEARTALAPAIKRRPKDRLANHFLGLTLLEQDQRAEAMKHFKAATDGNDPHLPSLYFLAMDRYRRNQTAVAAAETMQRFCDTFTTDNAFRGSFLPEQMHAWRKPMALRIWVGSAIDPVMEDGKGFTLTASIAALLLSEGFPDDPRLLWLTSKLNPASKTIARDLQQLLRNNPGAKAVLERFRKELVEGIWTHPERPGPYEFVRDNRVDEW